MMLCRLKRRFPVVPGAIASAAALAARPAYALSQAPSPLPGYATLLLALAVVVTLVALVSQILRARQERRAAIEASSVRSEFLANLNHEIRTPLNGVLGMAEFLAATRLDQNQREMLNVIRGSSECLLAIVNDILDYSRLESAEMRIEEVAFDLGAAIGSLHAFFEPRAAAKGLKLQVQMAPEVPRLVRGDPLRLGQILINLVGNGLKFTETGSVRLEVNLAGERTDGVTIICRVIDTGIGIDTSTAARLFAPFTQADSSTSRRYGGTGLGLAISHRLLGLLGGSIGVDSQPGKGSTFWFLLPLKVVAEEAPQPVEEHARAAVADAASQRAVAPPLLPAVPACGRRVLIVEDNPINQIVALRAVTGLGYEAELAPGGEEALAAFARDRFDAILMDCQMPGMDGYQVAAEMRRLEALATAVKPTPIIAMTANVIEGDQQKCVAAGMNDYLSKPMRLAPLARALEHWTATAPHSLTMPAARA
ncbi:MAG: ATP-binding protein [Bryobacteraceae bacterium]|jgi:signal transduction histidine kinase/CheY-like chemotaxis protein